jgi:predicted metal-dependent phosphoesterase TrpH
MRPIESINRAGTADLHTHNIFSAKDASATPEQIATRLASLGMRHPYLGITNHNTVEGATEVSEACKRHGLQAIIIPGEEVTLSEKNPEGKRGELISLFLKETIPAKSSIDEVITATRTQKGFVIIPHMFEYWRHGVGKEMATEVIRKCYGAGIPVAVEIFNARATNINNLKARQFAEDWNKENTAPLLTTAGSDAHYWREYGLRVSLFMTHFTDRDSFLQSLSKSKLLVHECDSKLSFVYRSLNRITRGIRKLNRP